MGSTPSPPTPRAIGGPRAAWHLAAPRRRSAAGSIGHAWRTKTRPCTNTHERPRLARGRRGSRGIIDGPQVQPRAQHSHADESAMDPPRKDDGARPTAASRHAGGHARTWSSPAEPYGQDEVTGGSDSGRRSFVASRSAWRRAAFGHPDVAVEKRARSPAKSARVASSCLGRSPASVDLKTWAGLCALRRWSRWAWRLRASSACRRSAQVAPWSLERPASLPWPCTRGSDLVGVGLG